MLRWVVGVLVAMGLLAGAVPSSAASSSSKPVGAVLQVRRLLRTQASCSGWKSEPPAGKPVVLRVLDQPGLCYQLGVSDLTVQGLSAGVAKGAIGWVVNVGFNKAQDLACNRMAVRDVHKLVSVVVEGIALDDPKLNIPICPGGIQIGSDYITRKDAERIARELDPG